MRTWLSVFAASLMVAGCSLAPVCAQQSTHLPEVPSSERDSGLTELTPVGLAVSVRSRGRRERRAAFAAQQHYRAAREAALAHQAGAYERECGQALTLAPSAGEIFLLRATQEVAAARYDAAIWDIAKAQSLRPRIAFGTTIFASTLNGMRLYEDAFLALRDMEAPEGESWQAMYERARAEVGMGDLQSSDIWSQRVLAAAPPTFSGAHLVRGQALAIAARWEEARVELALYQQSIAGQIRLDMGGARDGERAPR